MFIDDLVVFFLVGVFGMLIVFVIIVFLELIVLLRVELDDLEGEYFGCCLFFDNLVVFLFGVLLFWLVIELYFLLGCVIGLGCEEFGCCFFVVWVFCWWFFF